MFLGCALALVLLWLLIAEARRAQWSLFETLIVTAILGHVLVVPLALAIKAHSDEEQLTGIMMLAATVAMAAAFGVAWTFRNLATIGEKRAHVRLLYILLGALFIPSMFAIPFNLAFGWCIWLPMISLNGAAESARKAKEFREHEASQRARLREFASRNETFAPDPAAHATPAPVGQERA